MALIISCGHGGESGAVANFTTEHAEVVVIAKKLAELCSKTSTKVVLVPFDLSLSGRIKWINQRYTSEDLLIELHMDSATPAASGATMFYLTESEFAKNGATKMVERYAETVGIKSRGAKGDTTNRHGRLAIIRDTKPLAFLLEMGFITNNRDLTQVRVNAAQGIQHAVFNFLNLNIMDEKKPSTIHAEAVAEAIKLGISNGERPTEVATREEVIHMVLNAYKLLKK